LELSTRPHHARQTAMRQCQVQVRIGCHASFNGGSTKAERLSMFGGGIHAL
jgi:hypothetical protein